ncbi:MAG: ribonuclease P protein component [Deltaproteobacteria bacterium]|nr:ribonuclease P protein component [Deltaproteobacteria bacterium]
MGSFSFPKTRRILKRKDFVNLNRSGKKVHTEHFSITVGRSGPGTNRLGITASKRTGNAVQRNRIKRLVREFYRLNMSRLPQGVDLVIAAKKGAADLDLRKVREELGAILFDKARHP